MRFHVAGFSRSTCITVCSGAMASDFSGLPARGCTLALVPLARESGILAAKVP
jgi:hypothetical protein